jgi:glyoxylase-like metal-dependent hydrolase (beta-lactamase superfamily II)
VADSKLQLAVVVSQMFGENCFIAHLEGRDDCLVFDPGFEVDPIVGYLKERGLTPAAIVNTHGHADHIGGNAGLKKLWPDSPLVIGAGDADKLTDPVKNLSRGYGIDVVSPPADQTVQGGDTFSAAGFDLEVLEVPGHSCGHVVFVWKDHQPWVVFGGDVLFQGSVGRTDFPDGDTEELMTAIRDKLYTLPDDTVVLPGHGPQTTIGQEKMTNPFVRG